MRAPDPRAERILLLAPTERDRRLTLEIVAQAGLAGHACETLDELVDEFERGAGVLLLTEEVEASPSIAP